MNSSVVKFFFLFFYFCLYFIVYSYYLFNVTLKHSGRLGLHKSLYSAVLHKIGERQFSWFNRGRGCFFSLDFDKDRNLHSDMNQVDKKNLYFRLWTLKRCITSHSRQYIFGMGYLWKWIKIENTNRCKIGKDTFTELCWTQWQTRMFQKSFKAGCIFEDNHSLLQTTLGVLSWKRILVSIACESALVWKLPFFNVGSMHLGCVSQNQTWTSVGVP